MVFATSPASIHLHIHSPLSDGRTRRCFPCGGAVSILAAGPQENKKIIIKWGFCCRDDVFTFSFEQEHIKKNILKRCSKSGRLRNKPNQILQFKICKQTVTEGWLLCLFVYLKQVQMLLFSRSLAKSCMNFAADSHLYFLTNTFSQILRLSDSATGSAKCFVNI